MAALQLFRQRRDLDIQHFNLVLIIAVPCFFFQLGDVGQFFLVQNAQLCNVQHFLCLFVCLDFVFVLKTSVLVVLSDARHRGLFLAQSLL